MAAPARLLLKPAALLRKYDVGGGSSKVRFQRRLKDGLKMSEETGNCINDAAPVDSLPRAFAYVNLPEIVMYSLMSVSRRFI